MFSSTKQWFSGSMLVFQGVNDKSFLRVLQMSDLLARSLPVANKPDVPWPRIKSTQSHHHQDLFRGLTNGTRQLARIRIPNIPATLFSAMPRAKSAITRGAVLAITPRIVGLVRENAPRCHKLDSTLGSCTASPWAGHSLSGSLS